MKIGFIVDPLPSLNVKKDSTYAMMAEAARRGHELYAMEQGDLVWKRNETLPIPSIVAILLRQPRTAFGIEASATASIRRLTFSTAGSRTRAASCTLMS